MLVSGTGLSGLGTSNVTLKCTSDVTPTSAVAVSDTRLIVIVPGNADTAEACDLELVNPVDSTKTLTVTDGVRYI